MEFTTDEINNERWLPVINYNGIFKESHLISNLGRVKTLFRKGMKRERLLLQYVDGHGYFRVKLSFCGVSRSVRVHRLVGVSHVLNTEPNEYNQINHKKGNKLDNRASELEWCTSQQNSQHAVEWELMRKGNIPSNVRRVNQYSSAGELLSSFESITTAAKAMSVSGNASTICVAIKNKSTAYGYVWSYDGESPDFTCISKPLIYNTMKSFVVYKVEKVIPKSKNRDRVVIKGCEVYRGKNVNEACRVLGICAMNAGMCLRGSRPTVSSYVFEYA